MAANRFAALSEQELSSIIESKDSKNTKVATKHAVKLFKEYLFEKSMEVDFESFSVSELSTNLRTFYAELRTTGGEMYKRSSLQAVRSGLNRYLVQMKGIDITKDVGFKEANEMFVSVCKDTCKQGKGNVDHKMPIDKADLEKLYKSEAFNTDTPYGLVNKVWFEMCLYFCRRGRDTQRELKPSMFSIKKNADHDGKRFVCQIDSEIYKNHQGKINSEDKNVRMYESGGKHCPVKSFEKYLAKRNPMCDAFFQRPKDLYLDSDSCWFENRPIGKNKLGNRMKELSTIVGLSTLYTNHCIRATTITALSHAGYEACHIMTVSGHRNESSVQSYVRDTTVSQKKNMSATISSLVPEENTMEEDCLHDILSFSLSQTESFIKELTNYESCPTASHPSVSISASQATVPKNTALGLHQPQMPDEGIHVVQSNGLQ